MVRFVVATLLGGAALCASAIGDPILTIEAPAVYTPGEDLSLSVILTGAESLALYNVELVLSSDSGEAGTDYLFSGAVEPASRYVFAGQASDGFAYNVLSGSKHRITLSDLLTTGSVTTSAGSNDYIAEVFVASMPTMTQDLCVDVVADSLELDGPGGGAITGFDALKGALPTAAIPVPEPAAMTVAALLAGGAMRKRRARRPSRRPAGRSGGA
jgi:hypothetical protein